MPSTNVGKHPLGLPVRFSLEKKKKKKQALGKKIEFQTETHRKY
jgi:hypothetical protein